MNQKILYLSLIALIPISIMGCQKKVIYATSEVSGQVIDKKTNQPIKGVVTRINSKAFDITDEQGRFTVPPNTYEYTFIEPNHREVMSRANSSFFISKDGYEVKSYAIGGLAFVSGTYHKKNHIDMGKIYLMPVPVGTERENMTHYSNLGFCKPDQLQRQVDCIPVPAGKTYEQVSPNRHIE